jgi:hypothetical protein
MRQFPLKVGGVLLNFDTDGRVTDSADKVVAKWTTTDDNKIAITRPDNGGTDAIDVTWQFNADNQLVISQADKPVFTLLETTDGLPRFRLRKNVLLVDPDGDGDFEFTLRCQFGLNGDGNLVLAINGKESVLDGYIEDAQSKFRFQFTETGGSFPNSLVLSGKWERQAEVADAIRLRFVLDDAALQIPGKPLNLPQALRVDPVRNHLVLVYQSKTHGERRLQFLGSLEIKPNFTLVFRIDDVKDGSVRKSSITVESSFEFDAAKGNLQLYVGKTRTASSQVVEVSGALQVTLKNKATLDWTFAYTKSTAGGKATTTIATALRFEYENNKYFISYQQDGKTRRLDVSAKIRTEDLTIGFGATIVNEPQGRSIKAFIGVAW